MNRRQFIATTYRGRPAVMDITARVFYTCKTMERAREWAAELNQEPRK